MQQHQFDHQRETGRIRLPVRFDLMSSSEFRMPFVRQLDDGATRQLVVDLSQLEYIDSMGIGTLIAWDKSCRAKGKSLVLARCNGKIRKMLKLTGVEQLFEFAPAGV